jgi:hypothetical protein
VCWCTRTWTWEPGRSGRTAHAGHSVFQTTLQNGNPVIHPAVTLTNAALIERTAGDFRFYEAALPPAGAAGR